MSKRPQYDGRPDSSRGGHRSRFEGSAPRGQGQDSSRNQGAPGGGYSAANDGYRQRADGDPPQAGPGHYDRQGYQGPRFGKGDGGGVPDGVPGPHPMHGPHGVPPGGMGGPPMQARGARGRASAARGQGWAAGSPTFVRNFAINCFHLSAFAGHVSGHAGARDASGSAWSAWGTCTGSRWLHASGERRLRRRVWEANSQSR